MTAKKPPTKRRPGRPRIKLDLEEIRKLAALHCTDEEIAAFVGCGIGTIQNRRKDDPEFLEALQKGRGQGRISLRRAQMQKALGGNATMLIWLGKQLLGQTDRQEMTHDVTMTDKTQAELKKLAAEELRRMGCKVEIPDDG